MAIEIPKVEMSKGRHMPVIGLGTAGHPDPGATKAAVVEAIKAGYRHFDTAVEYGTEKAVGEGVAEALRDGLIQSRDELFITTKLYGTSAERHLVVPAIKMSLQELQMDYVDLYLVHFPIKLSPEALEPPFPVEYIHPIDIKGVWEGMEECHRRGLAKSIGVSNYSITKLQETLRSATIPPVVNQVEMNPMWQQKELREFCKLKGIRITAYTVLGANNTTWGDNRILNCPELQQIAQAKGKTVAQVAIRWVYEQGVSFVVKSYNKERMKENIQVFDWSLSNQDLHNISKLPQRKGVLIAECWCPGHKLLMDIDKQV